MHYDMNDVELTGQHGVCRVSYNLGAFLTVSWHRCAIGKEEGYCAKGRLKVSGVRDSNYEGRNLKVRSQCMDDYDSHIEEVSSLNLSTVVRVMRRSDGSTFMIGPDYFQTVEKTVFEHVGDAITRAGQFEGGPTGLLLLKNLRLTPTISRNVTFRPR